MTLRNVGNDGLRGAACVGWHSVDTSPMWVTQMLMSWQIF
jgi:hypothetical protein